MSDGSRITPRTLLAGLALGVIAGVGLFVWMLAASGRVQNAARIERRAVITVQALTDAVERAGGEGDDVRQIVATWTRDAALVKSVRVVDLDNRTLEASTHAADRENGELPRRLVRDEKELFDQAQRLRAAIDTNRDEGAARKEEIELEELAGGSFRLATPFARDGEAAGMVQIETAPRDLQARPSPWAPLAAVILPIALFLVAVRFVTKRSALVAIALLLLVAGVAGYAVVAKRTLEGGSEGSPEQALARNMALAKDALTAAGLPAEALDPAKWNVDRYRRPLGDAAVTNVFRNTAILNSLFALALFAFVGLGGAVAAWDALRRNKQAYIYIFPAMIGMLVLVFFPFFYGIALSFTEQNVYNTDKPLWEIFVGVRNYIDILSDFSVFKSTAEGLVVNYENFYWTLFFTIAWTVVNVAIGVSLGLLLALILNTKGLAFRPIYRVLLILPWAMPNYITALIWRGMFHQQFGVINQVVQIFGGDPIAWFEHPFTSFVAVVATNGWLSFPFMMVISLGALQSISTDLYEAARVDGASRWQQFTSITLPSLKPALVPAIILSVVWTFNMFNIIYLVSAGEPAKSTEILITQAYKIAFEQYRYGYAAAYSTVIFGILLVYGIFQNRVTRATESIA
ncbi:MAG: carbohydrate ABC transporter permease [Thermoanaerobaculia bacterium]